MHAPRFSVAVRESGRSITITLEHPASIGTVLVVDRDRANEERLVEWLRINPELRRIAEAPVRIPHPDLCLRLYNASQALGWSEGTVTEVTGMLVEAGALDRNEADWLRSTTGAR